MTMPTVPLALQILATAGEKVIVAICAGLCCSLSDSGPGAHLLLLHHTVSSPASTAWQCQRSHRSTRRPGGGQRARIA